MKLGDRVKITHSIDDAVPACRIGGVGTVTMIGDGASVDNMVQVQFDDGWKDSYWPEELEIL